jgi:hypothetical protein
MKIFASSGDEGGGGIEVPDPQSGGGGGMDTAALIQQQMQAQPQRDAIAQAVMAQQAQQAMQAQQSRGSPYGDFAQYFQPQSAPSGSPTDVGWMNALMPWQGGVTTGGQPGTPPSGGAPFTGGGSMAQANPNYWMGGGAGRGMTPKVAGYDDSWIGGGPGYAADPGTGNQGAPGSSGFADRGVFGPEDARGFPTDYAAPQHSAAYYACRKKRECVERSAQQPDTRLLGDVVTRPDRSVRHRLQHAKSRRCRRSVQRIYRPELRSHSRGGS